MRQHDSYPLLVPSFQRSLEAPCGYHGVFESRLGRGHEAEVLLGIDFNRLQIDFVLCEANCAGTLEPLGYVQSKLRIGGLDVIWARPGRPAEMLAKATEALKRQSSASSRVANKRS